MWNLEWTLCVITRDHLQPMLSLVVATDSPACKLTRLISVTLLTCCCFDHLLIGDMPDMLLLLKNADDPHLLCPMMTVHVWWSD